MSKKIASPRESVVGLKAIRRSIARNPKEYETLIRFVTGRIKDLQNMKRSDRVRRIAELFAQVYPEVISSRSCRQAAKAIGTQRQFTSLHAALERDGLFKSTKTFEKPDWIQIGFPIIIIVIILFV